MIKNRAIGVNFIDIYFRAGLYPWPVDTDLVLGSEGAGEVWAVGPDDKNFKIGDRVAYSFSPPLGAYCEVRDFAADKIIFNNNFGDNKKSAIIKIIVKINV